ncbi:MAG: hypothetical protein ACP5D2_05135 [Candidatus Nanoarchaeia archaeon]
MIISCAGSGKGQMKIQQMAIMIVAVLFFFILVGLFFIAWKYSDIEQGYEQLEKEKAITSLEVIANMPELAYDKQGLALDMDKLDIMIDADYDWMVESVEVYKIYPAFAEKKQCPSPACNYWKLASTGKETREYATYASLCKKVSDNGYVYDKCDIGKLVIGAEVLE